MKHACRIKEKKTAALIILSLVFALLTAAAVYCIHRFLLDNQDDFVEDGNEDYIDENGVCYTDEKNFVD